MFQTFGFPISFGFRISCFGFRSSRMVPMENDIIPALLRKIADLLDYQGVAFKPGAYRRAAQTIEEMSKDLSTFKDKKALKELPGIGDAIADKILEYRQTKHISFLDRLLVETQMGAAGLLAVDDLGPKRIREIEQKLNIRTIAELIEAAKAGKLQKLPRFSEKLEKKILEGAMRSQERVKRFTLTDIEKDVEKLVTTLRAIPGVTMAEAAGSFRRRKETVGDVDVLLAAKNPSEVLASRIAEAIAKLPIVERVVAAGKTRIAFDLKSRLRPPHFVKTSRGRSDSGGQAGLRTDIRIISPEAWGSALLYFTGSKEHNISLRRRAIERGLKLSEYGLFKGEKIIASKTEKEIYKALALPWIDPKDRTAELPGA